MKDGSDFGPLNYAFVHGDNDVVTGKSSKEMKMESEMVERNRKGERERETRNDVA